MPARPTARPAAVPGALASLARLALLAATAGSTLEAQARPALTPRDYARWESLGFGATFSPRGEWLAYAVNRVNEENEVRIRGGPRDTTIVAAYGSAPAFTVDGRWLAYTVGVSPAERERLERDRKPVRTSVALRDLTTGAVTTTAEISAFRFSADGRFLAMRRYPEEGKRAADLLVVDLARGSTLTLGSVTDWAWAERGALLAVAVEVGKGPGNAVQLLDAATGALRVLDSSPSLYRALAWRSKSDDLAVLRTKVDSGFRDTTHVVLAWARASSAAPVRRELDPAAASGYPRELRVAEHRRPEWAKDGSIVFVGLRPRDRAPARRDTAAATRAGSNGDGGASANAGRQRADSARPAAEKPSDVQVWHAKDVRIMPMQKVQEQQDLQRTLLAAWHLGDGRVVQLGSDLLEQVRVLEGARYATETDRKPYAFGTMFGRPSQDVWVIDVRTGDRRKALEQVRHYAGPSATGRKLLWYDGRDWWTQDVANGARTNLTARVDVDFGNPDWDYPGDMVPPVGAAGWTAGDGAVLVHDAFDVWSLAPDGSGARKLTDGAAKGIVHRYVRTGTDEGGIDLARGAFVSLFGKRTKQSGYGRLAPRGGVETLVLEDARVARLTKADSAAVFAFTRERFDDSPDWFVGGAALRDAKQASVTNPFQKDFAWGKSELVDFKSGAGKDLQAALYYPANYDPSRKYPMIVYTYELLSQNVHGYSAPSERGYYNHSVWTQNGYFVLQPDIVFRGREPGPSVLEAVVPAVRAVVARGLVDSARVGHVGHSWGGYEAAYLPTRTHIFAASVSGAAITNFLSFAGAVHWTPGIAEFDHWETGQARMDVPPWEDLEAYLRSSPIAKVQDLKTPMLMMFGDADGTVDWHQGIEFYNFARRAGNKDFVLLVYPGEDHGLRKKENQVDYHRRINQWFGHWLKGEPAPKWITDGYPWLERKSALDAAK